MLFRILKKIWTDFSFILSHHAIDGTYGYDGRTNWQSSHRKIASAFHAAR